MFPENECFVPVTPRGNSYGLLFTLRFSRRADIYAVSTAEITAEGTADILVNKYIPLWGCPASLLSAMMGCNSAPSCHSPCTSF